MFSTPSKVSHLALLGMRRSCAHRPKAAQSSDSDIAAHLLTARLG